MGADIHWYSECRNEFGIWECNEKDTCTLEEPDGPDEEGYYYMEDFAGSTRDYWFFGLLAGVRNEYSFSFEPKGFPDHPSEEVALLNTRWGTDAHSHSYLTLGELQEKHEELKLLRAEMLIAPSTDGTSAEEVRHFVDRLAQTIKDLKEKGDLPPEDMRLVFWFDN